MSRPELHIEPCPAKHARYACERFHYLGRFPTFKTANFGVWERGEFIGAIVFSHPLPPLRKVFGVEKMRIVELARVALKEHETTVSRILAITMKILVKVNPRIELIVSFADTGEGHHGGVYQAGGWIYTGLRPGVKKWTRNGRPIHDRLRNQIVMDGGDPDQFVEHPGTDKHRYVRLTPNSPPDLRERVEAMSLPYPKRAKPSDEAAGSQPEEGGSIPTRTLQSPAEAT